MGAATAFSCRSISAASMIAAASSNAASRAASSARNCASSSSSSLWATISAFSNASELRIMTASSSEPPSSSMTTLSRQHAICSVARCADLHDFNQRKKKVCGLDHMRAFKGSFNQAMIRMHLTSLDGRRVVRESSWEPLTPPERTGKRTHRDDRSDASSIDRIGGRAVLSR